MIRLLIAEDNAVVRQGLAMLLNAESDISVIGQAADGQEVIDLLKSGMGADIVLTDLKMPKIDGIRLTAHITQRCPTIKVVIHSMHDEPKFKNQAQSAGAKGYVVKLGDLNELCIAIRQVFEGKTYFN